MFVVCVTQRSGIAGYEAFLSLDDAERRFKAVEARIPHDFDGVALFEVGDTDDPKKAVKTVKSGKAKLLERDLRSGLLEDAGEVLNELFASRRTKKPVEALRGMRDQSGLCPLGAQSSLSAPKPSFETRVHPQQDPAARS